MNIDTRINLGMTRLVNDMKETIRYDSDSCLPEDASKEDVIKAFNEQISEAYDFVNNHAKDNFLDQCLLYLAIRIVELRGKIKNFKSEDKNI